MIEGQLTRAYLIDTCFNDRAGNQSAIVTTENCSACARGHTIALKLVCRTAAGTEISNTPCSTRNARLSDEFGANTFKHVTWHLDGQKPEVLD